MTSLDNATLAPFTAWGPDEVAAYLLISVRKLNELRADDRTFPAPRMIGSLPRWSPLAVAAWLADADPTTAPTAPRVTIRRGRRAS